MTLQTSSFFDANQKMSEIPERIANTLKKYLIIGGCTTKSHYILLIEKDMGENYDPYRKLPDAKIVSYSIENNDWSLSKLDKRSFKWLICHGPIENSAVIIGSKGYVYDFSLGEKKSHHKLTAAETIPEEIAGNPKTIKNIRNSLYISDNLRTILRRDGMNQWTSMTEELQKETAKIYVELYEANSDFDPGFDCIDGFASDHDLYAAGGKSDVWHYDGKDWHPVDIPLSDMRIEHICCASDGYIYIAGRFGVLLKGKDDDWQVIEQDLTKKDFLDIADYQGNIYLCTEYRLYTLVDDQLQVVDFGEQAAPVSYGSLYVNHGQLLSAGTHNACVFNGERWKNIYNNDALEKAIEFAAVSEKLDSLERELDELTDALQSSPSRP